MLGLAVALLTTASCDGLFTEGKGEIVVNFLDESYEATKAAYELPDTNDFILEVKNSKGSVIYKGKFGAAPEKIEAPAGTYTVNVISQEFSAPAFDRPQYGDSQTVKLAAGQSLKVDLICALLNSGMRLKIDSSFLTEYPQGLLHLKSTEGRLLYAYRETRVAYFNPGRVSLVFTNDGREKTLLTRSLQSRQVLTIKVSAAHQAAPEPDGITLQVDTSKIWTSEDYCIGGDNPKGDQPVNAYSVPEAKNNIDEEDVWVYGYIVGGDMTSSATGISFSAPFESRTHLAIAAKSSVTEKSSCLSVFLPDGDIREDLNLVDSPGNLGRQLFIRGDIVEKYYGVPGLKNVTEFQLK